MERIVVQTPNGEKGDLCEKTIVVPSGCSTFWQLASTAGDTTESTTAAAGETTATPAITETPVTTAATAEPITDGASATETATGAGLG